MAAARTDQGKKRWAVKNCACSPIFLSNYVKQTNKSKQNLPKPEEQNPKGQLLPSTSVQEGDH